MNGTKKTTSTRRKSNTEYFRKYRAKNREKLRLYNREYNRRWRKENGYDAQKKRRKKNREWILPQFNVEQKARRALKKGLIERKPCEKCGDTKSVMHHPDYSKPYAVQWLCRVCHRRIHYANKTLPVVSQ